MGDWETHRRTDESAPQTYGSPPANPATTPAHERPIVDPWASTLNPWVTLVRRGAHGLGMQVHGSLLD